MTIMFKIGEFSKLTQVSIRMLRHYDQMGLLKPDNVDPSTGYRLYSAQQIPLLQKIILLRDSKFGISEIKNILENWNEGFIIEELERKKKEISLEITREQLRIDKINKAVASIQSKRLETHYNVIFKEIPSYSVLSLREMIPDYCYEGILWDKMYRFIEEEHIEVVNCSNNNLAIYYDQEHKENAVDVEIGVVVKKKGVSRDNFIFRDTEPVKLMACSMVYGSFDHIAEGYYSFCYWLEQNQQYQMYGFSRQICHKGPMEEMNPDHYVTEIQIPVMKTTSEV